jgi:hypothetical protein
VPSISQNPGSQSQKHKQLNESKKHSLKTKYSYILRTMAKRGAAVQLTDRNWDREEESEEVLNIVGP